MATKKLPSLAEVSRQVNAFLATAIPVDDNDQDVEPVNQVEDDPYLALRLAMDPNGEELLPHERGPDE